MSLEPVDNRRLTVVDSSINLEVNRSVNCGSCGLILIKTRCTNTFLFLEKCHISIGIAPLVIVSTLKVIRNSHINCFGLIIDFD